MGGRRIARDDRARRTNSRVDRESDHGWLDRPAGLVAEHCEYTFSLSLSLLLPVAMHLSVNEMRGGSLSLNMRSIKRCVAAQCVKRCVYRALYQTDV